MHGEVKLRKEGYRTRDGHVLEWIERLRPDLPVTVRSRPEPFPRVSLARRHGRTNPGWDWQSPQPVTLPPLKAKREWWVKSLRFEPQDEVNYDAAIVWNPIAGAHLLNRTIHADRIVVDLLDDWSRHIAFLPIRESVEEAYSALFQQADIVTANSEGTIELAARFGREAELIPNGCDPELFGLPGDCRTGKKIIVGYAGKLSERLDPDLIADVAKALPDVRFEIAGPFATATSDATRQIQRPLQHLPNVTFLGDIPYPDLPALIATWDFGWVPHRVGEFEVGGDAIKIYEYRAAGLPVLSTSIIGTSRAPAGVAVFESYSEAVEQITGLTDGLSTRPGRIPAKLPESMTWETKTSRLIELAGL
jgi:glycosyltransferase involved in cell wall biosynthesis